MHGRPAGSTRLLHNATAGVPLGLLSDLWESDAVVTEATRVGMKPTTYFWGVFYGTIKVVPTAIQTLFQALQGQIASLPSSATIDVERWMGIINAGRTANPYQKILLVGHSEGTAYVNLVYNRMAQTEVTSNTETNNCTQVFQMASITPTVANGGRYVTGTNDRAIQLVRAVLNNILPANIFSLSTDTKDGWLRHGINEVYLFEPNIVAKVKSDMAVAGTDLVRECIAPTCNGTWGNGSSNMDDRENHSRLNGPVTMSYRIRPNNPGFVGPSAWHADHVATLGGQVRINRSNVMQEETGTFTYNFRAGQPDLINMVTSGTVRPNGWVAISARPASFCISCGSGTCSTFEGKNRSKQWWLNGSVGNWECPDIRNVDVALNNIITNVGQKIRNGKYLFSTNTRGCFCRSAFGCPSGVAPRIRYGGTVVEVPRLGTFKEIELR